MCGKCSDIMFLCVDSRCCVVNPAFFVSVAESPVRIVVAFGIAVAEICLGGKDNGKASYFKRGYKIVESSQVFVVEKISVGIAQFNITQVEPERVQTES